LARLVNDAYGRTERPHGWTSEDGIVAGPRVTPEDVQAIVDGETTLLVAKADEELIGCVHLAGEGGDCELGLLSVEPDRQDEGLGRAILKAAEAHARDELEAKRIVLHVVSVREDLIAWYERRGYTHTGVEEPFDSAGDQRSLVGELSFVVLEKRLA
jgi:ribosomal protein S18 acetylase RimI-like enzyme